MRWLGGALAAGILFCVIAILGVLNVLGTPVGVTKKSDSKIPETAFWVEGRGGGSWIELLETTDQTEFHLRIYRDFTGEIELDTWFGLSGNCREYRIPLVQFPRVVKGYDGTSLQLLMQDGRKDCELRQVFPRQGISGTRLVYEINRQEVSEEQFTSLKSRLAISDEFEDGEMVRAGRNQKEAHRHGKVHLRDAVDLKTGKHYQYSISTMEEQTVYSLTENHRKPRRKN